MCFWGAFRTLFVVDRHGYCNGEPLIYWLETENVAALDKGKSIRILLTNMPRNELALFYFIIHLRNTNEPIDSKKDQ